MILGRFESFLVRTEVTLVASHIFLDELVLDRWGWIITSWAWLWRVNTFDHLNSRASGCPHYRWVRTVNLTDRPLEITFKLVHSRRKL